MNFLCDCWIWNFEQYFLIINLKKTLKIKLKFKFNEKHFWQYPIIGKEAYFAYHVNKKQFTVLALSWINFCNRRWIKIFNYNTSLCKSLSPGPNPNPNLQFKSRASKPRKSFSPQTFARGKTTNDFLDRKWLNFSQDLQDILKKSKLPIAFNGPSLNYCEDIFLFPLRDFFKGKRFILRTIMQVQFHRKN